MTSGSTTSSWRPRRGSYLVLFAVALVVFAVAAGVLPAPGYMDAEYYLATGRELALGHGFSEPFIWNYLADPHGLPTPSHAYWMPLASLLAALLMPALGLGFRAAQVPFVLLAGAIPVLAAQTSVALQGSRKGFWLAGGLALLPGLFLPYFVTTDTFAVFAIVGGSALWMIADATESTSSGRWVLIGGLIGLGHLARADGLLLWAPALYVLATLRERRLRHGGMALLGYAIVTIPWWWRNVQAFGSPFPPGAARSLWLLDYDELFSYPADLLTPSRWWAAGLGTILVDRLEAVWTNLQSVVAVNGSVVLLPLALAGGWSRRHHPLVRAGSVYFVALFVFMGLVFPFAGARGGYFHSSAALMPLVWALAAAGVGVAAAAAPRWGWDPARSWTLFAMAAVLAVAALSLWSMAGKSRTFARNEATYTRVSAAMNEESRPTPEVIAVVDPPGFFAATGVSAVALPDSGEQTLREVVRRFGVDWIVVEADHPRELTGLYTTADRVAWLDPPLQLLDSAGKPVVVFPVRPEAFR